MIYIVTGSTGNVGTHLVSYLRSHNLRTHCIVHSASKAPGLEKEGCTTSIADINNPSDLSAGFSHDSPSTVFFLHPEDFSRDIFTEAGRTANSFVQAVRSAGNVKRVIFLSTLGAELASGSGFLRTCHIIERILQKELECETIIIRAAYFMENWALSLAAVKDGQNILTSTVPNVGDKLAMVAASDIAHVIGDWMVKEQVDKGIKVVQVVGPDEYAPQEVANAAARILKRDVSVEYIGEQGIRNLGKQLNWSEVTLQAWIETAKILGDRRINLVHGDDILLVRGTKSLTEFCSEQLA
ncbi:uncharacterized protein SPPG_02653 [Spizellomyces punctatus DAOM BR117]|uniref:NmrA-like domain-containing protein n=1 Tax=Spizellomyces punctatus (strain DAOM BR117) TaxID=645134 RepID=A0A0L0HL58_SPIPD|nr:uncharacterized protein SPPG_02653 [Spizellomyces punctatus DAOM BR117]KND02161.1 hypothetical protein SPPG_02653 [Spizellomyces punctatus DAOM BR117]|eukprot:XP_016610200.1 hypothetical protein SPPG_02653 [Spizellomyces punctatus DAOM BR117]